MQETMSTRSGALPSLIPGEPDRGPRSRGREAPLATFASFLCALCVKVACVSLLAAPVRADDGAGTAEGDRPLVLRAGKVVTMDRHDAVIDGAVVVIEKGVIAAVGTDGEVALPANARVLDLRDRWVVPGFVDCHDHIAGSLGDLNDGVYLTNPGLRSLDTVAPENENLKDARAGGVTCVLLIPGSGNNMSGFGTAVRTWGRTVDEMLVRYPGSLKIAQAGNPERYWFGVGRSYMNWNLGQTLRKARAYHERWLAWERTKAGPPPEKDPTWDDFRGLFARVYPTSVHTQIYQVVNKTILQLHDEFGLMTMLDHSEFDGWKNGPLVAARERMATICGPRTYHFDRHERRIIGLAERWRSAGVKEVGINTDAPVVPQEEQSLQAALNARLGLDRYEALRGLTIVPAKALMVDERMGSIEVGKEANLGVWTGDPVDPRRQCTHTFVRGHLAYDASKERRF